MNIKQKNTFETCSKNISQFIKYVQILTSKGYTKYRPYKFQKDLLNKFSDTMESNDFRHNHIVIAPRQCGKTTIAAIYVLWYALFNNDKCIGITANKLAQAKEILNRVKEIYERLPDYLKVKLVKNTKERITFENGTYIFASAMSYSSVCGKALDLLIFDEMAFSEPATLNQFMMSIFPTQANRAKGQMILMSTPNGNNAFYEIYSKALEGKSSFIASKIQYNDIPGRDEAWKKKIIRDYGVRFFEQEYNSSFIISEPLPEDNVITLNINTSPLSKNEAKGLMEKLVKLFSKKLTIKEIEDATYDVKIE